MVMCLLADDEPGLLKDEDLQPQATYFRIEFFEMQKFVTCLGSSWSCKTTIRELQLLQEGLQQFESCTIRLISRFPIRTVIID